LSPPPLVQRAEAGATPPWRAVFAPRSPPSAPRDILAQREAARAVVARPQSEPAPEHASHAPEPASKPPAEPPAERRAAPRAGRAAKRSGGLARTIIEKLFGSTRG
jgi:hypothetical protein